MTFEAPKLIRPLCRCPNPEDPYTSELIPVPPDVPLPGHYRRFLFKMFAFVDNLLPGPSNQQVVDGSRDPLTLLHAGSDALFLPPFSCTSTAAPRCASLLRAASVNRPVTGSLRVRARFFPPSLFNGEHKNLNCLCVSPQRESHRPQRRGLNATLWLLLDL